MNLRIFNNEYVIDYARVCGKHIYIYIYIYILDPAKNTYSFGAPERLILPPRVEFSNPPYRLRSTIMAPPGPPQASPRPPPASPQAAPRSPPET